MRDLVNSPFIGKDAFIKFTRLVQECIGLALDDDKEYLLDSRLTPIAKSNGFNNYAELIERLNNSSLGPLHWESFEALLTNETMFFRDEHFFLGLKNVVIPALIKKNSHQKSLGIWCTAVSSGQEAYSLAILIREFFPELQDWNIRVHASDICKKMINKAKEGIYNSVEIHRGLTENLIQKYFHKNEVGLFVADDSLKKMIHFFSVNLIGDLNLLQKFDLILIRNVLIYFLPETKAQVLQKIRSKLIDDESFLMMGATETLIQDASFKLHRHGRFSFFTKNNI